ncbi:NACHT domain-containing protein [Lentzea sp. NPDC006480]|uniref:NACHT domain-containing protein n=1 Tax=Lentzea sp. NPDC006480 TaxID=3157176 RepID=UPI0033BD5291
MPSIESAVIRVVADVSESLADRLAATLEPEPVEFSVPRAEELLQTLGADAEKLLHYLDSLDFAAVAAQCRIRPTLGDDAENQVRQGLRLAGLPEALLEQTSRVVHDTLILACEEVAPLFGRHNGRIDQIDIAASAATSSRMLGRLKSLTRFRAFAARMCDQVAALHNSIRLPHIGVSRAVRYNQLYVRPDIISDDQFRLGAPGDRTVILGDPGAGKSTLAAKFAHDIARDGSGRVPFLVVLREFTGTFDQGGHDLLHYLEMVSQAPYNVKAPPDAVEYLLRTGQAVVVLDGLDEVVQTELRRRVAALVEGFAHLYPLVPIVVTARRIGYEEAPLDKDRFATAHIQEFSDEQVKTYVRRWFVLDEATSPAERKRLTDSFIEDSDQIVELRSNALLLALLCAMYSSDRYLPRNLAQVYERCAVMLFEQWDAKRGIPLPLKFHGRLRGAVQHLAWTMFTAPESGRAQSRTRIVNILTRYLEDKLDDHDESIATAEQFLAFCTGRAWILTDVGATDTEPQFGFTHRTFLEYFAAEYLVRTHRTAADLWEALRPNIGQWEVVAQVALQLYDRNVEGGADELLTEAVAAGGLDFAARSLHHMHPSTRTVRRIAEEALRQSVLLPIDHRTQIGLATSTTRIFDGALYTCMYGCSPTNLSAVEHTVQSGLATFLERGEPGAIVVLELMCSTDPEVDSDPWPGIRSELAVKHAVRISESTTSSPWGAIGLSHDAESQRQIIQRFGARAIYLNWSYYNITLHSLGVRHLNGAAAPHTTQSAELLATTLAEQPTPWARLDEFKDAERMFDKIGEASSLTLMLSLPFLELATSGRSSFTWPQSYSRLRQGRSEPSDRNAALRWLELAELHAVVREFLDRWVRGEISVTAEPPEPPQEDQEQDSPER